MKKSARRLGFTLPEILVTVTIIAVLAAVIVPTVLQYATKGDAPSALSSIDAVKKGIVGFTTDTRHYPRTLNQLTNTITTAATAVSSTDLDLLDTQYSAADAASWKGPYFDAALDVAGTTYDLKALGITFTNVLSKCGSPANFICATLSGTYTNKQIDELDKKLDSGTGTVATDATSGNLIWVGGDNADATVATSIRLKLGVAN